MGTKGLSSILHAYCQQQLLFIFAAGATACAAMVLQSCHHDGEACCNNKTASALGYLEIFAIRQ